jgi:rhodanese-related sulfurtransferase
MMKSVAAALALAASLTLSGCAESTASAQMAPGATQGARVETITAAQLAAMMAAGEVVLVDVRTPAEFAEVRLAGALNAPLSTFDPASIPMEQGRETILMCRSSRRSGQAAEMLSQHTGGLVRHLEGGIIAWQEAGLETLAEPAPAS